MNLHTIKICALRPHWFSDLFQFYVYSQSGSGISLAHPLVLEHVENAATPQMPPTFELAVDAAQALMDSLWDLGLRPSEGTGSAGSLKATQNHLADMRSIVAKSLGVELK